MAKDDSYLETNFKCLNVLSLRKPWIISGSSHHNLGNQAFIAEYMNLEILVCAQRVIPR